MSKSPKILRPAKAERACKTDSCSVQRLVRQTKGSSRKTSHLHDAVAAPTMSARLLDKCMPSAPPGCHSISKRLRPDAFGLPDWADDQPGAVGP
eukprot:9484558-Pyramimonas_sp.AAC.1